MQETSSAVSEDLALGSSNTAWSKFLGLTRASFSWKICASLALLNILFLFIRPQHNLPFLSTIKFHTVLYVICLLLWIPQIRKSMTVQIKLMIAFVAFHGVLILAGLYIYDKLILNDGVAFARWIYLVTLFFCFLFPLVGLLRTGDTLKRLIWAFFICSCYLGVYSFLNEGRGPGSFLSDENDMCLVLLMFLPYGVFLALDYQSLASKIIGTLSVVLLLAGIVATNSRGGTIGLAITLLYIFINLPKKRYFLAAVAVSLLVLLPLVPSKYWDEVKTIQNDTLELKGTVKERLESWKIGAKMFFDPQNTIQGVGLDNSPWNMRHYEPAYRGVTIKSLSGRQIHSVFFQIICDTGILGILFFISIVSLTWRDNKLITRKCSELISRLMDLGEKYRTLEEEIAIEKRPILMEEKFRRRRILLQVKFLRAFSLANNASLVAIGAAGASISILYYPPIWFCFTVSSVTFLFWQKIEVVIQSWLKAAESSQIFSIEA